MPMRPLVPLFVAAMSVFLAACGGGAEVDVNEGLTPEQIEEREKLVDAQEQMRQQIEQQYRP